LNIAPDCIVSRNSDRRMVAVLRSAKRIRFANGIDCPDYRGGGPDRFLKERV
jgi:hypothetical protein